MKIPWTQMSTHMSNRKTSAKLTAEEINVGQHVVIKDRHVAIITTGTFSVGYFNLLWDLEK